MFGVWGEPPKKKEIRSLQLLCSNLDLTVLDALSGLTIGVKIGVNHRCKFLVFWREPQIYTNSKGFIRTQQLQSYESLSSWGFPPEPP